MSKRLQEITFKRIALVTDGRAPAVDNAFGEASELTKQALDALEEAEANAADPETEEPDLGEGIVALQEASEKLREAQVKLAETSPDVAERVGELEKLLRKIFAEAAEAEGLEGTEEEAIAAGEQMAAALRAFAAGKVHSKKTTNLLSEVDKLLAASRKLMKTILGIANKKRVKAALTLHRAQAAMDRDAGKELLTIVDSLADSSFSSFGDDITVDEKVKLGEGRKCLFEASGILSRLLTEDEIEDPLTTIENEVNNAADAMEAVAPKSVADLKGRLETFLTAVEAEPEPTPEEEVEGDEETSGSESASATSIPWKAIVRADAEYADPDAMEPDFEMVQNGTGGWYVRGTAVLVTEGERRDKESIIEKTAVVDLVKTQSWAGMKIELDHPSKTDQEECPTGLARSKVGELVGPIFKRIAKAGKSVGKAQALSRYVLWGDPTVINAFATASSEKLGSPYDGSYDSWAFGRIEKSADGAQQKFTSRFGEGFAFAIVSTGGVESADFNAREAAAAKRLQEETDMTTTAQKDRATAFEHGANVLQAVKHANLYIDAHKFGERAKASAEAYIRKTYVKGAKDDVLDTEKIEQAMEKVRAACQESTKPGSSIEGGTSDREQASAIVDSYWTPDGDYLPGVEGFRAMASSYIAQMGHVGEDGKAVECDDTLMMHCLAATGRAMAVYYQESNVYTSPIDRRFPYIKDRQKRFETSMVHAEKELNASDNFAWKNDRVKAALMTTGLPLISADVLFKMNLTDKDGELDGPGPGNPPDETLVRHTKPVKDFRDIKMLEREAFGTIESMPEGANFQEAATVGERQELAAAQWFGNLVTVSDHLKRADDVGFINEIPADLMSAYNRTVNRTIFDIPLNNPLMSDGVNLFDAANHFNATSVLYTFQDLLGLSELLLGTIGFSQGAGAQQEHLNQSVMHIISSLGSWFEILRDTLLDTQPDTTERGGNAFVRAFGNIKVWFKANWDTAGTTDRILLVGRPWLVLLLLDGIREGQIFIQDDPRFMSSNSTVFKIRGGHGIGNPTFRRAAAFL